MQAVLDAAFGLPIMSNVGLTWTIFHELDHLAMSLVRSKDKEDVMLRLLSRLLSGLLALALVACQTMEPAGAPQPQPKQAQSTAST